MSSRQPIGYVVEVDGTEVTLNLLDHYRGMVASHSEGVSPVTEIGCLLGIDSGHQLLVLRVDKVNFAEPKEVHRFSLDGADSTLDPLRNIKGTIVGIITRSKRKVRFIPNRLVTPALGAAACPLQNSELKSALSHEGNAKLLISVGTDLRSGLKIDVDLQDFISRHVAVLGGSGQGKSCFTAAFLQQIVDLPNPRVIIFDVNGEYKKALESYGMPKPILFTKLGPDNKIPYYSLGKQGIRRLLVPSDKSQSPALKFALNSLMYIKWFDKEEGVGLEEESPVLFDDFRTVEADEANKLIRSLRDGFVEGSEVYGDPQRLAFAQKWPPMKSLGPLIADGYSLAYDQRSNMWSRNSFLYGHVSPLITRIHSLIEDSAFSSIIDIEGGDDINESSFQGSADNLIDSIFGNHQVDWKVHIVDIRDVAQDLMPIILGSLLDLYAARLFERGQDRKIPTLLVLEEAHHYLRSMYQGEDEGEASLAYERLAKEGRKFGLALWLSTQRPSEVSPTVLSQCNNWVSFRLTSEKDISAVQSASEWADRSEVKRISGLSRRNALLFGGSTSMPILIKTRTANPLPNSEDAAFNDWGVENNIAVDEEASEKDNDKG